MYEALIFIDQSTKIDGDSLLSAMKGVSYFTGANAPIMTGVGPLLRIAWGDFTLDFYHTKGEHVLENAKAIARGLEEGHPKAKEIGACRERIQVASSDDLEGDYFNHYVLAIEAIEELGCVYSYDFGSGSFMNL